MDPRPLRRQGERERNRHWQPTPPAGPEPQGARDQLDGPAGAAERGSGALEEGSGGHSRLPDELWEAVAGGAGQAARSGRSKAELRAEALNRRAAGKASAEMTKAALTRVGAAFLF